MRLNIIIIIFQKVSQALALDLNLLGFSVFTPFFR